MTDMARARWDAKENIGLLYIFKRKTSKKWQENISEKAKKWGLQLKAENKSTTRWTKVKQSAAADLKWGTEEHLCSAHRAAQHI